MSCRLGRAVPIIFNCVLSNVFGPNRILLVVRSKRKLRNTTIRRKKERDAAAHTYLALARSRRKAIEGEARYSYVPTHSRLNRLK